MRVLLLVWGCGVGIGCVSCDDGAYTGGCGVLGACTGGMVLTLFALLALGRVGVNDVAADGD